MSAPVQKCQPIVARLRHLAKLLGFDLPVVLNEAADRIEELENCLEKVRSYNVDIAAGRINYRPGDHIAVIDRCGMEQPYTDVSILKKALREFVAAYKLQDCDNYTEELARAYSIADAALSGGVARAPINHGEPDV